MKKVLLAIAAVIVIILLLLQTRFVQFYQVDRDGFAVETGDLKRNLLLDPENEDKIEEEIPYYEYHALDNIYRRGNSFYMGEQKKTAVDLAYPLLTSDGTGVRLNDDQATIFDTNFDAVETYTGLILSDGIAYNPGGDRADAADYTFCRLSNGLFVNLTSFEYENKGENREVTLNSFINFTENYFTYYEPVNGVGIYKAATRMTGKEIVRLGEKEYTYEDFLEELGVIGDKFKKPDKGNKKDEVIPTPEITQEVADNETQITEEEKNDEALEVAKEKPDKADKNKDTNKTPQDKPQKQGGSSGGRTGGSAPSAQGAKPGNGQQTGDERGVRPDTARPDKKGDKEKDKVVENYVKPTVTVNDLDGRIYRIFADTTVYDPAGRISKIRQVQFEVYEQSSDGKEELVLRTYTGGSKNVEMGSGVIKPGTTYRINAYFTYTDEYDKTVVEAISMPKDGIVTTGTIDKLGDVVFKTGEDTSTGITYMDIPFYYDNMLEIVNVAFDEELSDPEAVYGISNRNGIVINIDKTGSLKSYESKLDNTALTNFKKGIVTNFDSINTLDSNSKYSYEIVAKDYFGNAINLVNNTGVFETCKSRPSGNLTIKKNEIGNLSMQVEMHDYEDAAVKNDNGDYDVYYVVSTKKYNSALNGFTWDDVQDYIDNEYSRVPAASEEDEEGCVHFVYKFSASELLNSDGEIDLNKLVKAEDLDLNTRYHAYLLTDYDLNNNKGVVEHGEICSLDFTAASLSSIGNIYVKVDISNVSAHSAVITYTLNEPKTNDVLEELLTKIKFDITPEGGDNPDSSITFDANAIKTFTGWYYDENGEHKNNKDLLGSIIMDASFFEGDNALSSMTQYKIVPDIKATYNGKDYDMKVVLTNNSFKTMREPAKVEITNDLFAGGSIKFDAKVIDPDGAICGNSGHVVVARVYDNRNNLVKTFRIPKNTETPQHVVIDGLDSNNKYFINFIAVEYNEGYTNQTLESNVIIERYDFDNCIDLSGKIELFDLQTRDGVFSADTRVMIDDNDQIMKTGLPYFISVEKNGVDITSQFDSSLTTRVNYNYENKQIRETHLFPVEKGKNEYKMTLYVYYNGNKIILDTTSFTTEDSIVNISTKEEFVEKLKKSNGVGRFILTEDIDLGNSSTVYQVDGQNVKIAGLVSNFNGQLDLQGHTLAYDKTAREAGIFTNIGPKGEVCNGTLEFRGNNEGNAYYDQGMLSNYNYGHIHDIIVDYKGGTCKTNQYFGLLCRYNTTSGIIERFVVKNNPDEGKFPFTADYSCGLVCGNNKGIVRNGYVYGDDIFGQPATYARGGDTYIGGIVGNNDHVGQVYNVFSLCNVIVGPPSSAKNGNPDKTYGAVTGNGTGNQKNMYSVGMPSYNVEDANTHDSYDKNVIGPVVGTANSANRNMFYWNNQNYVFANGTNQKLISLENLYDYGWQQEILGSEFDTSPVEVGYYPQVIMRGEVAAQEYIPLPDRTAGRAIELNSADVIEYFVDEEKGDCALVEFRLTNNFNAAINSFEINGLKVEVDEDSAVSADGYTTIRAVVYDPTKYVSQYEIEKIGYTLNGRKQEVTFNPKPLLLADFYRDITTPEEWYEYVVKAPTENARVAADISFAGVPMNRIEVTAQYTGKLTGNKRDGSSTGYALKDIDFSKATTYADIFRDVRGEITDLVIEDIQLGTNRTSYGTYTGFVRTLYGTVSNVHMNNVEIYGNTYMGSLVAYAAAGSVIQDCSASNVNMSYKEANNSNTNALTGGLVGYLYYSRLENCYVRKLNLEAGDLRSSQGIGGVIGNATYATIDSAYATGKIDARAMDVGGIVGYYVANKSGISLKNLIARVDVTSSQDCVGGLVGEAYLTEVPLTERNNLTGVAFGNVTCKNTMCESVSFTTGYLSGYRGTLYGSDFQLLNGVTNSNKETDANTYGLIDYVQACDSATYTDEELLCMEEVYDYSFANEGYLPKLYYSDGRGLLPFQDENISITSVEISQNEIQVLDVGVNESESYIWMDLKGIPNDIVTSVVIKDLHYQLHEGVWKFNENGTLRLLIDYDIESSQEHFLDSYYMTEIGYTNEANSKLGVADFSENPVRIPLIMYKDIWDVDSWNAAFDVTKGNGNYENYRIIRNIDFAGSRKTYVKNAKIGRLIGVTTEPGGVAVLSNIFITANNENLIFRLNSEISNISFENVSISNSARDNVGIIGASAGEVYDMTFNNITISSDKSARNYVGIIGYQQGGCIGKYDPENPEKGKVVATNITVGQAYKNDNYVGAICGYAKSETKFENIVVDNIDIVGTRYIGGVSGSSGKIHMDNIDVSNAIVLGRDRIGGIIGSASTGHTSVNSAMFNNIRLTGTPVVGEDGKTTDSTTVIGVDTSKATDDSIYVGGMFGYIEAWGLGRGTTLTDLDETKGEGLIVDGIVVRGYGDYVGGIAGQNHVAHNAHFNNSLLTVAKVPDKAKNYIGGISGRSVYGCNYNQVNNSVIDVTNYNSAGIVFGYVTNGTVQYIHATDSNLLAKNTLGEVLQNYGGIVGNHINGYYLQYSSTINCKVDASDGNMEQVGGLAGYESGYIIRSFAYGTPDGGQVANGDVYVKGGSLTGGLAGVLDIAGKVQYSYNNLNVISNGDYAGGLVGAYNNNYTTVVISGTNRYTYASCYMTNNYFAGRVEANEYAGGFVGRLGMPYFSQVSNEHKVLGGRLKDKGDLVSEESGSGNETAYTAYNLLLASEVKATSGNNAYAFAGNFDGFEGRANVVGFAKDPNNNYNAKYNYLFAGTKLINKDSSAFLCQVKNSDYGLKDNLKNSGIYRYKYFGEYQTSVINDKSTAGNANVRLITSNDLKMLGVNDQNHIGGYAGMKWRLYQSTSKRGATDIRGDYYRLITADAADTANYGLMGDADLYMGRNLLPHIRINTGTGAIKDYMTTYQSEKEIAIPVPEFDESLYPREELTMASRMMVMDESLSKYSDIYVTDIDKVNIEFGEYYASPEKNGYYYFILKYGNEIVDKQLITKRVFTYNYDFKENLTYTFGPAYVNEYIETKQVEGKVLGEDFVADDIFDDVNADYFLEDEETVSRSNQNLMHHVMTYNDKYYYIDDDGVWSGSGSGVKDADSSDSREDSTASCMSGDYLTLYYGKALASNGNILSVTSGEVLRKIEPGITPLEVATTLEAFAPHDMNDISVETYNRFSEAISGGEIVTLPVQYLQSSLGEEGYIDWRLENVKDSVVMYTKGYDYHCTILGTDGMLVDMAQGDNIGAPEDFKNSGIVYMTNNFYTTAPFILVEYANGGIVGYNYETGEYLFDHSIDNTMSIFDFAKVYFGGDKSELGDIAESYSSNAKLAEIAETADRLAAMVNEVNNDRLNDAENGKSGTVLPEYENINEEVASSDTKKAGDRKELHDDVDWTSHTPADDDDNVVDKDPGALDSLATKENDKAKDETVKPDTTNVEVNAESNTDGRDNVDESSAVEGTNKESGDAKGDGEIVSDGENKANGENAAKGQNAANGDEIASGDEDEESNPGNIGVDDIDGKPDRDKTLEEEQDGIDVEDDINKDKESMKDEAEKTNKDSNKDKSSKEPKDNGEPLDADSKEVVIYSTAGTPVITYEKESDGINVGEQSDNKSESDEKSAMPTTADLNDDDQSKEKDNSYLITVYNAATGTYEIVDKRKYLTDNTYYSENAKLDIKDLSAYTGYAVKENEKKKANGIGLYVLVSALLLSGVGGFIYYRKKKNIKI